MSITNAEKNDLVTLSVDIPFTLKDQLKFKAYKENKSIKEIVKAALEEYFEKDDK